MPDFTPTSPPEPFELVALDPETMALGFQLDGDWAHRHPIEPGWVIVDRQGTEGTKFASVARWETRMFEDKLQLVRREADGDGRHQRRDYPLERYRFAEIVHVADDDRWEVRWQA